nr:hypothetical protein [Methylomarinum sp. Ch1-1]MDP4521154.1 hypothetical protein [Methylomarinum sp. Ch1-1]
MKRIKNWCASYRQHTLPHRGGRLRVGWLREASHQNPHRGQNWRGWIKRSGSAKTRAGAKLAVIGIQADCLAANPPYGRDAFRRMC